ncbi:heparinase II/III family protein, partial [Candidatus Micrarchaeota archaeon]|nr:heparinase II/III family protein [Candidatus Micrarchaeota archaeon]MBU1939445.1 heparinase II/III family protein [Candidatus Micrarchaeota archaeon]
DAHYLHYSFSPSELPDDAAITSAKFHVKLLDGYCTGNFFLEIRPLGIPFSATKDTWNQADSSAGVDWTNNDAGKSDSGAAFASGWQTGGNCGWKTFEFNQAGISYLQDLIAGGNAYLILYPVPEGAECATECKRLAWQSEASDAATRPYFEITYTTGGGGGECTDGEQQQCGTTNTGECEYGTQTCSSGTWGACTGEVQAVAEVCGDGKDNDCDGQTDEGCETQEETCQDGTAYGECSETGKGKMCVDGVLVNACDSGCDCASGYNCTNGTCQWAESGYSVNDGHPRVILTPERLEELKGYAAEKTDEWVAFEVFVKKAGTGMDGDLPAIESFALAYLITGEQKYLTNAKTRANGILGNKGSKGEDIAAIAIYYDWLYNELSPAERAQAISWLNTQCDSSMKEGYYINYPFHNYGIARGFAIGLAGAATYYENGNAETYLDSALNYWWKEMMMAFNEVGSGGGWEEGPVYMFYVNKRITYFAEGMQTALGRDIYNETPWFRDRMYYGMFLRWPPLENCKYNKPCYRYPAFGDAERSRDLMLGYERIVNRMLIRHYADTTYAKNLEWYEEQENQMYNFQVEDFLFALPDQPQQIPTELTHYADGVGKVLMRSDWTQNAAQISFTAGPHITGHEHLDNGSFTIFNNGADLAIDAGIYDGSGSMSRARDYAQYLHRGSAHNIPLIYMPGEQFRRELGQESFDNDGGQRTEGLLVREVNFNPADNSKYDFWAKCPQGGYQRQTAEITNFEDGAQYTYTLADLTNSYNNPECAFSNSPKVENVEREFLYLRPNYVVVFDRITSLDASYAKVWPLHTLAEPDVSGTETELAWGESTYTGSSATITNEEGRLFVKALLPEQHVLRTIGGYMRPKITAESYSGGKTTLTVDSDIGAANSLIGVTLGGTGSEGTAIHKPIVANTANTVTVEGNITGNAGIEPGKTIHIGKDSWIPVVGDNGPTQEGTNYQALGNDYEKVYGWGRLQVEPKVAQKQDNFLVAIQVADSSVSTPSEMSLVNSQKMSGALINASPKKFLAMFSKTRGKLDSASYSASYQGAAVHVVADMESGIYDVELNGSKIKSVTVSASQGVISFESVQGNFTIHKTGEAPPPPPVEACGNGAITLECDCGGTVNSSGYCCSGTWQSTQCDEEKGCPDGQVECDGQCVIPVCSSDTDCAEGDKCNNAGTCTSECIMKLTTFMKYIEEWKAGNLTLAEIADKMRQWKSGSN